MTDLNPDLHDPTTLCRSNRTACAGVHIDERAPARRPRWRRIAALCFMSNTLLCAACTDDSVHAEHDEDGATSTSSTEPNEPDETSAFPSRAPVIEQLTGAPSALTPWDTVTVTAVVSDPDGLDDIKAGLAFHESTGAVYRSFTEVDAGVYESEFTWSTLKTLDPIEFAIAEERQFLVQFFDYDGLVGSAVFDLQLHCYGAAVCDGVCSDLNEPDHCGACEVECDGACVEGQCTAAK